MRNASLLRALLIASCTAFVLAFPGAGDPVGPLSHPDGRRVATAGMIRVETGVAGAAAPRARSRRAASGWSSARGSSDSRDTATWILFSVLVVLLGGVTIRMVRGFDHRELFDRLERDDMETQLPG